MYRQVKREKSFTTETGAHMHSVATLADEHGGKVQIAVDDRCYVLYLKKYGNYYEPTQWIFDEVHTELITLPPPSEANEKIALELEVERIEREKYAKTI